MPNDSTVFVDTNVLLYVEDRADEVKQNAAIGWMRRLWVERRGRISVQVLHEFYANATRKLRPPMPVGDARTEVRRYQRWHPWTNDQHTVETAWGIESRFQLSYWDALIVAAALHQGCSHLLSEDLQHGQQFDSVRVVNPFLAGPDILSA